jgi:hypothetical protein
MKKSRVKKSSQIEGDTALVGVTDKDGKFRWEKVEVKWREVRPAVRKPKRKAG